MLLVVVLLVLTTHARRADAAALLRQACTHTQHNSSCTRAPPTAAAASCGAHRLLLLLLCLCLLIHLLNLALLLLLLLLQGSRHTQGQAAGARRQCVSTSRLAVLLQVLQRLQLTAIMLTAKLHSHCLMYWNVIAAKCTSCPKLQLLTEASGHCKTPHIRPAL